MKATVFLRLGLKLVCLTVVNFCLIVVAHLIACKIPKEFELAAVHGQKFTANILLRMLCL